MYGNSLKKIPKEIASRIFLKDATATATFLIVLIRN
jgi:hypothetical protein